MTKRQSFADRIAAAIPAGKVGLSLEAAAAIVGGPGPYARRAFEAVAASGVAMLVRRGRGGAMYLVRPDAGVLACVMCQREYQRGKKSKRLTCSKSCQSSYAWQDPEKAAARCAKLKAAGYSPKRVAALAAMNKRRWSDHEEHEKLAAQNRREWRKPEKAAVRAAKIRINNQSPEFRAHLSEVKKQHWKDPVIRQRMHDAAASSQKVQAYRDHFSEVMKKRWQDGDLREKYTNANRARNAARFPKSGATS